MEKVQEFIYLFFFARVYALLDIAYRLVIVKGSDVQAQSSFQTSHYECMMKMFQML